MTEQLPLPLGSTMLTVEQAAALWQVPPRVISDLIEDGSLPCCSLDHGRYVRIPRQDFDDYAVEITVKAALPKPNPKPGPVPLPNYTPPDQAA